MEVFDIYKRENIDLTQGSIYKKLFLFFLPILLGSLFQQLYTTVDAIIVGQYAGKAGLASIDSVYNLLKLPINFFVGLSTGATIIISQFFGAKKSQQLSKAVHTAIAFSIVGGIILSIVGIVIAPFALNMLEVPSDIYASTLAYVRIYFAGLAISLLYNIGAGILRAVGDSKNPFYYLIVASTINVLLDFLFVGAFHWGVTGAAIATVISQLISAVLVFKHLMRTSMACRLSINKIRFYTDILKQMIVIGLPIALQSSLYPIANMMIQANINGMGTDNIAAWALCGKLDFLIWLSVDSLAVAISTFSAQNCGANQSDRIKRGTLIGIAMTLAIVIPISAILYHLTIPLGTLFISATDYDVLPIANRLMQFLAPFYFIYVFGEMLSGVIRGTGQTVKPMLITLIGTCITRIGWILLVVPKDPSMLTIIASYPISWLITSLAFIVYYVIYMRKLQLQC